MKMNKNKLMPWQKIQKMKFQIQSKIEDNDEEKNEDSQSRSSSPINFEAKHSENEESATILKTKTSLQLLELF